eukprot:COSAG06_NODE_314_length_17706_cov_366.601940_13_plen_510_part_00
MAAGAAARGVAIDRRGAGCRGVPGLLVGGILAPSIHLSTRLPRPQWSAGEWIVSAPPPTIKVAAGPPGVAPTVQRQTRRYQLICATAGLLRCMYTSAAAAPWRVSLISLWPPALVALHSTVWSADTARCGHRQAALWLSVDGRARGRPATRSRVGMENPPRPDLSVRAAAALGRGAARRRFLCAPKQNGIGCCVGSWAIGNGFLTMDLFRSMQYIRLPLCTQTSLALPCLLSFAAVMAAGARARLTGAEGHAAPDTDSCACLAPALATLRPPPPLAPQLQPSTRPALACHQLRAPAEHTSAKNRPPRCFCRRRRAAARSRSALARATGCISGWIGQLAWSGSCAVAARPCVAMRLAPKLLFRSLPRPVTRSARCRQRYSSSGAAPRSFTWSRASAAATRWTGRCRTAAWAAWKPSCVANRSVSACCSTVEARRCHESLARRLWPLCVIQALVQPSQQAPPLDRGRMLTRVRRTEATRLVSIDTSTSSRHSRHHTGLPLPSVQGRLYPAL